MQNYIMPIETTIYTSANMIMMYRHKKGGGQIYATSAKVSVDSWICWPVWVSWRHSQCSLGALCTRLQSRPHRSAGLAKTPQSQHAPPHRTSTSPHSRHRQTPPMKGPRGLSDLWHEPAVIIISSSWALINLEGSRLTRKQTWGWRGWCG